MGLLSKIFNTDKLEYILREEDEFSVTAPQNWNVELLTVGDFITPDMWGDEFKEILSNKLTLFKLILDISLNVLVVAADPSRSLSLLPFSVLFYALRCYVHPFTMLFTMQPVSLVATTIWPHKFAITVLLVVDVLTNVQSAVTPSE